MTTAVATRPAKKKAQPPKRRLDPVSKYAREVLDGRIIAGRAVRLACERHFRDLSRARTRAFPYYFDEQAARHIIDFFPTFLTLENGKRFVLPPWLQFSYGSIFGWKRVDDDLRRIQHGYLETSKGSGKTPSAGGVALYGAGFDDEDFAEIYSTGFDKGQAQIILNDAVRMANNSPEQAFKDEFIVGKYNIAHPASGSFIRAMSSQHQSKSGPRPHFVLSDEIHEHRDGTVVDKAESGFKNRAQPLGLKYTNSGSDKASYCWQLHQKSFDVLEGVIEDEQWFAYVCHLDPCPACFADGYRQPKDGCKDCDDWTDPKVWPKIAPALRIVIQPKYLQDQIDKARTTPSSYALIRRLNFCIWTETHQIWIGADRWDACKTAEPEQPREKITACTAAFDMSEKLDLTANVIARRIADAPDVKADTVSVTEMEGAKEVTKTLTLNFSVELIPFFWIPEETMLDRIKKERIPYDAWEREGFLRVSSGPIVDHDKIFEEYTQEIVPKYKPTITGYDAHNATQFGNALRTEGRLQAVEIPQGRALSEAYKWFEALVAARRIKHHANPVLAMCVANCEAKWDRYRNLWVEKPSATKRIDGAVAAVMALSLLLTLKTPQFQMFFVGRKR